MLEVQINKLFKILQNLHFNAIFQLYAFFCTPCKGNWMGGLMGHFPRIFWAQGCARECAGKQIVEAIKIRISKQNPQLFINTQNNILFRRVLASLH